MHRMIILIRHLSLLITMFMLISPIAHAVNPDRLFLPKKYIGMKGQLMYAAQVAESSEECVQVVSGSLDLNRSTQEQPVFRIDCRNKSGVVYSVSVKASKEANVPASVERSSATEAVEFEHIKKRPIVLWHVVFQYRQHATSNSIIKSVDQLSPR